MAFTLVQWLRSLGPDRLAELLRVRSEILVPGPRSLSELANMLSSPLSVGAALHRLDTGCHDALAVICTLGDGCTRDAIERFLGVAEEQSGTELDRVLRVLQDNAMIWPTAKDNTYRLVGPLRNANPMELGDPAEKLLQPHTATTLRAIADALDLPPTKRKADSLRLIKDFLSDPEKVRAELAKAPAKAQEVATEVAWHGPKIRPSWGPTPAAKSPEMRWLTDRGFFVEEKPPVYGLLEMPVEVGLALRGPDYHPPLTARPPAPPTTALDSAEVDQAAALAATRLVDGVARLLERCATNPMAQLQNGGIGVRVLKQVAKAFKADQHDVRLWLETAAAAGLLSCDDAGNIVPADGAEQWREEPPAQQYVSLLRGWWELPYAPTADRMAEKPGPALLGASDGIDRELRQDLLGELAEWDRGQALTEQAQIGAVLAWKRPTIHGSVTDIADPLLFTWAESDAVGATARGALSAFGLHCCKGDDEALRSAAEKLMPGARKTALLQADLTAVVAGTPSGALSAMLNLMADPENRDTASTWRFSPASVRRAMDQGHSTEDLLRSLAEISDSGIPQTLEYLINDVGRRFGELKVRPVQCCVLGDEALLLEVSRNRSLRDLALRELAPTVLASRKSAKETLAALRKAGYSPIQQTADGTVAVERVKKSNDRAPIQLRDEPYWSVPEAPDADEIREIAERLLAQPDEVQQQRTHDDGIQIELLSAGMISAELLITEHAVRLADHEIRLLVDAVDNETPVHIEYLDQNGRSSSRIVTPFDVNLNALEAYCHLREDNRNFRLERIRAVSPANLPNGTAS
ncbi:helicase-associated domain-containing protein [Saccharopolyspora phatthalungensis]|uniref:Helicase XPB/Ssl2 N-terminal domain-containing protein n=1 Tax=Saccharopolyspora phatthalungensis TaxID=664693 RepID=A0A840Q757_9PSEU|nr:helicase-associated domain-containing protein [Saccharopolyspora phatthalungensis]MBB5155787.1 hypothetical protein [Saccharopolyspora phatthalungensis]